MPTNRPLAIVTGASTGIGYELAKLCASNGFDLIVAADEADIHKASVVFQSLGAMVEPVEVDLATLEGVEKLYEVARQSGRPIAALMANAGRGLGGGFLDQDFKQAKHVLDTNILGTIYLIHLVAKDMRARHDGRILITGSIAGFIPGSYQAVYNGTKAFLDNFALGLRNELQQTGITVSCLMPGATQTAFFERAGMVDTEIGQMKKDDPADVAKAGFDLMMSGESAIVSGWQNKLEVILAKFVPSAILADRHGKAAKPHSAINKLQALLASIGGRWNLRLRSRK